MTPPLYKDLDFTLLRALHALIEERGVTGAARRLGVSQPAASRALQKLRLRFGDPLLVRKLGGMVLTPRAEALRQPLRRWMAEGEAIFRPQMEAPALLRRVFRIASTDYGVISVIGPALARLAAAAPEVGISVSPLTPESTERLKEGELDLIISGYEPDLTQVHARFLFKDAFICMAREDHPLLAQAEITPEAFLDWPQIVFTVMEQETTAFEFADHAARRRVILWTQNVGVMPMLALQSDAVVILPSRAMRSRAGFPGLRPFSPPFPAKEFNYWLFWHERNRRDPAIQWLIEQFGQL